VKINLGAAATKASANVARGPNKKKPDQQDASDQNHPKLEVNIHY
jgi:hypothetical protein